MLKVIKRSKNRLDLELSGPLDSKLMKIGLEDLLEKAQGIERGKMLYSILDFEIPTAGALGIELMRLPQLFALIRRFDRCAVLSNEMWLRTIAEFEGVLLPGLEIKSFEFKDFEAAVLWLEGS